ncbi:hypothetical protein B566_EDAN007434 [Ephemera danica]|nr:hypothetical protein B566_EDAN007434 [Ephemera danica]
MGWRTVRSVQNAPWGRCPYTTAATSASEAAPRPFHEMPGPRSFPLLGTLWRYLPLIARKFEKYGPAVREEIVSGVTLVWLFSPADIEVMYRSGEGKYPRRRSHLAMQHFRQGRPHIYSSGGLLPTNGTEWWRLRTVLQRAISRPRNVKSYIPGTDVTLKQFLQLVRSRVNKEPEDFMPELSRLFTEVTGLVAFDARLGALEGERLDPNSRAARLVEAAFTANSCVLHTDNGPQLWRVAVELIQSKVASLQEKAERQQQEEEEESAEEPPSLLEQYLSSPDLDRKDVIGMVVDMLMAGVDTTVMVTQNQVSCRQSQWFREPLRFLPERWIKGHPQAENAHPFLSLPFGHGPRTCIARRLAEQSVQLLLLRIIRDFEVTWEGEGEMDCFTVLINKPDKPLKLRFRSVP